LQDSCKGADILLKVPRWVSHRLGHLFARSEVDDSLDRVCRKKCLKLGLRGVRREIDAIHAEFWDTFGIPRYQIIDDDHVIAALPQQHDDMRTDVSGTTGDKNAHRTGVYWKRL
jgi:hypothetical protein